MSAPPESQSEVPSSRSDVLSLTNFWRSTTLREKLRRLGSISGGILLSLGFLTLVLYLRYISPSLPDIYVEQFDIIAPNQTAISTNATGSILYKFKFYTYISAEELETGTSYHGVNITFYYRNLNNLSFVPMANSHIDPFYESPFHTTDRRGQTQTSGVVWESSLAEMLFKVELKTKVNQWGTKKKDVHVGGELQVNEQGKLTKKYRRKELSYYSAAAKIKSYSFRHWVILVVLIVIYL